MTAEAALAALRERPPRLVVVGGSAGAFDALVGLLAPLPRTMPPIAVVVHVAPDHESRLAEVLQGRSKLVGREVCDKDAWEPGTIHVAPPGYHVLVERDGTFALSIEPPVSFARPSIDVLFQSAAWALGPDALAILLSGASGDGGDGARVVRATGGQVWVQKPSTARFATMPEAGLPHATATLTPDEMGDVLATWARDVSRGRR